MHGGVMAKKTVKDIFKLMLPLSAEKRRAVELAKEYLDEEDLKTLTYFLKIDRCFPVIQRFGTTAALYEDREWPFFKSHLEGKELHDFLSRINHFIAEKAKLDAFGHFAPQALERITANMAPNIVGMEEAKAACAIQLFAKEPVHVLLIGDPGTGKTDILRSLNQFAPISSFGLGSGVSGVGLSAVAKGDEILKGLLPLADGGIACIDELNLVKAKDLAALYNAMEKGFVTYDKGGRHETIPAKVRVCATANPTTGTFVGRSAEVLRKQVPFGDPLLSRFHFVFVIRKPTQEEFEEITKRIVKGERTKVSKEDAGFLAAYIHHAESVDVTIDPGLELEVVGFIKELKRDERRFLQEVGPRTVVGIVRIVKAIARSELSPKVRREHLERAFALMRKSLYVREGANA